MNLPNKITFIRVFMIPLYLIVYLAKPLSETPNMWLALIIFALASITDGIDGYVARKYKMVTNFGKLMDPLADKLLVSAALIAFTASGALPAWAVILLVSREFYVSGLRMLAIEQGKVLAASGWGKFKTASQITLVIYILTPISWLKFDWMVTIVLVVTIVASLYSALDYTIKNKGVLQVG